MCTVSRTLRIASTAAWSAASFSPRPIQRAAAIAAASVTRTSSSAMFRSGAGRLTLGILSVPLDRVRDEPREHDLEQEEERRHGDAGDERPAHRPGARRDDEPAEHAEYRDRDRDRLAAEDRSHGDEDEQRADPAGELQEEATGTLPPREQQPVGHAEVLLRTMTGAGRRCSR